MIESHNDRFEMIRNEVANARRGAAGIGTLAEKSVHAVLKAYYAPDSDALEVAINGYVADVCYGHDIVEIQTRHFYTMKKKLEAFLPEFDVTVVYPLPLAKTIINVDPDTGTVLSRRKSPKKRSIYEVFPEMYGIRMFMNDPRLHFKIVCLEVEEYRFAGLTETHGRKTRILSDTVPVRILEEIDIYELRDLIMFVPPEAGEEFTRSSLAKAAGIPAVLAGYVTALLKFTGVSSKCDARRNREIVYKIE